MIGNNRNEVRTYIIDSVCFKLPIYCYDTKTSIDLLDKIRDQFNHRYRHFIFYQEIDILQDITFFGIEINKENKPWKVQ